jgi:predicted O-methyltransferase YrrM
VNLKNAVRRIIFALSNSPRLVLLDYPVGLKRSYDEGEGRPHPIVKEIIDANRSAISNYLNASLKYKDSLLSITDEKLLKNEIDPGWNNGYFPGLDVIMLYTIISELNPRQYIEIGSGTSTKIVYKAKVENHLITKITAIDPSPRKEIEKIVDVFERKKLQDVSLDYFRSLEENDVVFFDGTHLLFPNSDVMWFFLEVMPLLKKGVVVQIHDIYLPYDYPQFMIDRYYNEQYILASCLLSNPNKYEVISPNYYIYTDTTLHDILQVYWQSDTLKNVEKHGGSFWFRIM